MSLETVLTDIIDNPIWQDGLLVDYGSSESWPLDSRGNRVPQDTFPKRTLIQFAQIEDNEYFAVIGQAFGCNGHLAHLTVSEGPRFKKEYVGEIAFAGKENHEWHIVPKDAVRIEWRLE